MNQRINEIIFLQNNYRDESILVKAIINEILNHWMIELRISDIIVSVIFSTPSWY